MILFCLWRFVINDYLRQHPFNFTSFVYVFPWFCSHSGPCGALGHRGPPWGAMASDEDLELQAKAMAEKTLPSSLPPAARAAKLPAITAKILERLRKQRDEAEKPKVTGNGNSEDPNPPPAPPPPPKPPPPKPPPPRPVVKPLGMKCKIMGICFRATQRRNQSVNQKVFALQRT